MGDLDMWYFEVHTHFDGVLRGFSRQIKARADGLTVPRCVNDACIRFLDEAMAGSDVHGYPSVLRGEGYDHPYRYATYHLMRNGETVVRSAALRPVRPEVLT